MTRILPLTFRKFGMFQILIFKFLTDQILKAAEFPTDQNLKSAEFPNDSKFESC